METDFPSTSPNFSIGEPKNNTLALVSLGASILGLPFLCLSLIFGICVCASGLLGIGALVTGFIARQKIQTSGEKGNGIAIAGMVIGGIQIFLVFGIVLFWLALMLISLIGEGFSAILFLV